MNKATLTVPQPRKIQSVSCRIEHLASKTVAWCETEQQHDDNAKYSISYVPTDTGEYEFTATVNGLDLAPHRFHVFPNAFAMKLHELNS